MEWSVDMKSVVKQLPPKSGHGDVGFSSTNLRWFYLPCGAIRATIVGLSKPLIFKYLYISTKLSGVDLYTLANINGELFDYFSEKMS